jgi:hypothetical protein
MVNSLSCHKCFNCSTIDLPHVTKEHGCRYCTIRQSVSFLEISRDCEPDCHAIKGIHENIYCCSNSDYCNYNTTNFGIPCYKCDRCPDVGPQHVEPNCPTCLVTVLGNGYIHRECWGYCFFKFRNDTNEEHIRTVSYCCEEPYCNNLVKCYTCTDCLNTYHNTSRVELCSKCKTFIWNDGRVDRSCESQCRSGKTDAGTTLCCSKHLCNNIEKDFHLATSDPNDDVPRITDQSGATISTSRSNLGGKLEYDLSLYLSQVVLFVYLLICL